MDELLRSRVERALETLPDDKVRQLLDYIEFLQSRYAERANRPSTLERFADGVEDTLRVSRVPLAAIKGTRDVISTADKVVRGLTDAGRIVFDEISGQFKQTPGATPDPDAAPDPADTPDADPPAPASTDPSPRPDGGG